MSTSTASRREPPTAATGTASAPPAVRSRVPGWGCPALVAPLGAAPAPPRPGACGGAGRAGACRGKARGAGPAPLAAWLCLGSTQIVGCRRDAPPWSPHPGNATRPLASPGCSHLGWGFGAVAIFPGGHCPCVGISELLGVAWGE